MNIQYEEYMKSHITLINLLREESIELRRKCEYMEIVENENAKLKEMIMKDDSTGHQIAYLTKWEIRQRQITDATRPAIQRSVAAVVEIPMKHLERFEGEPFADEAMDKLRLAERREKG